MSVPDTARLVKVKVIQPRAEGNPYLPASDDVVEMDAAVATSLAASGLVEIVDNKPNAKTATIAEKE
jgi:hypothetical protein